MLQQLHHLQEFQRKGQKFDLVVAWNLALVDTLFQEKEENYSRVEIKIVLNTNKMDVLALNNEVSYRTVKYRLSF